MRRISLVLSIVMIISCLGSFVYAIESTVTDVLTREFTGVASGDTTYPNWDGKTGTSGAVYAGQSSGDHDSIQLNEKNDNNIARYPGIVTTSSCGKVKKITVAWNQYTSTGKSLKIYGKTEPYAGPSELYTDPGTHLGTLVCNSDTELTVEGDYTYIGFYTNNGAVYLDSISIEWDTSVDPKEDLTVSFDKNGGTGEMESVTKKYGQTYELPENGFTAPADKKFAGWTIAGEDHPVGEEIVVRSNVTVMAKWVAESEAADVTDVLDYKSIGVTSGSYDTWSNITSESDAVYAGNTAGGQNAIQLRSNNSNSGIITTASAGSVNNIEVKWNSQTINGRTLNIYGNNTAYVSPSDLYDPNKQGDLIGTIVYGTGTELKITNDYAYIGIRSNDGALFLDSISITWDDPSIPVVKRTVSFVANGGSGSMDSVKIKTGSTYKLPGNGFTAPDDKVFAGWLIGDNSYKAGDKITVDGDLIVKAQWGEKSAVETSTDVIDNAFTQVTSSSYATWAKAGGSGAEYSGKSANNSSAMQFNSKDSIGIVTTKSVGRVSKITVDWADNTNTLDIYVKNSAYESTADLYNNSKCGTLIGSLSADYETELEITGDYEFIGIRSRNGVIYLNSITIEWEISPAPEPQPESKCTITFDGGESSDTMDPVEVEAGAIYELPYWGKVKPEGKVFKGWKLGTTDTVLPAGQSIAVTDDITLTAMFTSVTNQPNMNEYSFDDRTDGGKRIIFENMPEGTVAYRAFRLNNYKLIVIKMEAAVLNKYCFGKCNSLISNEGVDKFYISLPAGYTLTGEASVVSQESGVCEPENDNYRLETDGNYYGNSNLPSLSYTYVVTLDNTGTHTVRAEYNTAARLEGHSLSLGGDIGINFFMSLSDDVRDSQNAYMLFTKPDGTTSKVFVKDIKNSAQTIGSQTYYVFKCGVPAKEMHKSVTAQMYINGSAYGDPMTYSVRDYAEYLIANKELPEFKDAVPVAVAMLNYGAAAQKYFGVDLSDLANKNLDPEYQAVPSVTASDINKPFGGDALPSGITFEGTSLSLKSETTLSLYFTSSATLNFSCAGRDVVREEVGNYQVARIRNINVKELGNELTVTVSTGSGEGTVTYCPLTYCYNVLSDSTGAYPAELRSVCQALYAYYSAAVEYKG